MLKTTLWSNWNRNIFFHRNIFKFKTKDVLPLLLQNHCIYHFFFNLFFLWLCLLQSSFFIFEINFILLRITWWQTASNKAGCLVIFEMLNSYSFLKYKIKGLIKINYPFGYQVTWLILFSSWTALVKLKGCWFAKVGD